MNIRQARWTTEQTKQFFEITQNAELYATVTDTRRIVSLELTTHDGTDIGDVCRSMLVADGELNESTDTGNSKRAFEISDSEDSGTGKIE